MNNKHKSHSPLSNLDASFSEKKQIIYIYALRINKLLDYYHKQLTRLSTSYKNHQIDKPAFEVVNGGLVQETKTALSTLLIEQYYNTGDYNLFDHALQIEENIELVPYSIININEADIYDDTLNFIVFYKGIFFPLKNSNQRKIARLKLLVRDEEIVAMVNKKLDRARQILEIDEISLGKKFYDGLCHRSHFWHK